MCGALKLFRIVRANVRLNFVVVLNAVGHRNTAQKSINASLQKGAKERFRIKIANNQVWALRYGRVPKYRTKGCSCY